MRKKQAETIIFNAQWTRAERKQFIQQVNIVLSLIIVLLLTILFSRFFRPQKFVPSIAQISGQEAATENGQVLSQASIRVPILMYHYVENVTDLNDTFRMSMNIPPDIFEQQITSLKENGYTFITMQELVEGMRGAYALPDKPIVLTFDDGYRDFYDVVFPIIKKHNVKVVAYISPGLLDSPNYMDVKHVIEISKSGLVEIGGHTVTHYNLAGGQLQQSYYEIFECRRMLEEMIGEDVTAFAYPYGAYDDQAVTLAKEAGFTSSVTTNSGVEVTSDNMHLINRIRPGRNVGEDLMRVIAP